MKSTSLVYLLLFINSIARPVYHGVYTKSQMILQNNISKLYQVGVFSAGINKQNPQFKIGFNHGFNRWPVDLALEVGQRTFPANTENTAITDTSIQYHITQFQSVWTYRYSLFEPYSNIGAVRLTKKSTQNGIYSDKTIIRPLIGIGIQKFYDGHWFLGLGADWILKYTDISSIKNSASSIQYVYGSIGYLI